MVRADSKENTAMSTLAIERSDIIAQFKTHEGDVGSPDVQIALLTRRIIDLTEHVREHKHDYHSRRGLIMMVGKRNRLLRYLSRTHRDRYQDVIKRLGLRK